MINGKSFIRGVIWPARYLYDVYAIKIRKRLPVLYYDSEMNVGDDLNKFLLERLSGKEVHRVKTRVFRHVLPVGSILNYSSRGSIIYGSGSIDSRLTADPFKFNKILALRGCLTKDLLLKIGINFFGPLGDPALLMPNFYYPNVTKNYKVGLVLHYLHKSYSQESWLRSIDDVKVIDVQQPVEYFVREMLQCEYVISSSLHGLILADAYKIPNQWIVFGKKLKGGDFKFQDYYSTTDCPDSSSYLVEGRASFHKLIDELDAFCVKKYRFDSSQLRNAFLET